MHVGRSPVKAKKGSSSDFFGNVPMFSQSKCPLILVSPDWRKRWCLISLLKMKMKPLNYISTLSAKQFSDIGLR